MKIIITFFISLPILAGLDFLFLGYLMKDYYFKLMSPVVTIKFNLYFAFLFYFFYLLGVFFFVLYPNLVNSSLLKVFLTGTLFGFICYMTYDLTNLATLKDWPVKLAIIDILWGSFVTALVSAIAYQIFFWIK